MNLKIDPKLWTFLILISIGVIICASFLIVNEILGARKECELINGEYSFNVQGHFCNERSFVKYYSCFAQECNLNWVFEDSIETINFSQINLSNSSYKTIK